MRKIILLFPVLLFSVSLASGQTTQTLRAQWEIEGPPAQAGQARPPFDVATAQGYVYKMYQVGSATGIQLTGVTCTTTADAFIKTCASTVPTQLAIVGISVDMTATIGGIETSHSNGAVVPPLAIPPSPPTNLRLLRYFGTIPAPTDAPVK